MRHPETGEVKTRCYINYSNHTLCQFKPPLDMMVLLSGYKAVQKLWFEQDNQTSWGL